MGRFGQAAAGSRTAQNLCEAWPLCSAADANAWWDAGVQTAKWLRAIVPPETSLPPKLRAKAGAAFAAAEPFESWWGSPLVALDGDIARWAAQQQAMLDFGGLVVDWQEGQGSKPAPGGASGLVWIGVLLVGAAVIGGTIYYVSAQDTKRVRSSGAVRALPAGRGN